jgi:Cupredoxin-like domain
MRIFLGLIALFVVAAAPAAASAAEIPITLKSHKFTPTEVTVPAHKAFTLKVTNQDATPEEFESKTMDFEKVVAGNQSIVVHVLPLAPGKYVFYGEYHEATAHGHVVAK